jgi:hypothetical protein
VLNPQGWETLTPREKLAKKREVEAAKRELELKLASMNMNKDRLKAADRKTRMLHDSNVGLPGGKASAATADPWDLNTMGSSGVVNMATMPSAGGRSFVVDPQIQTGDWQRNASAGPLPSSFQTANSQGTLGGGDTVLMGSVVTGTGGLGVFGGDTMVNLGTVNLGAGDTVNLGTLPTLPGLKRAPAAPAVYLSQPPPTTPSKDVRYSSCA